MSLKDLEKELYGQKRRSAPSRKKSPKKEARSLSAGAKVESPWEVSLRQDETQKQNGFGGTVKKAQKYGKGIVIGLVVVLVVMMGLAGYYLYQFFTTRDVVVGVEVPSEVLVGQTFDVSVTFDNTSSKTLTDTSIKLTLPDGVIDVEQQDKRVVEQTISDVVSGQAVKETFHVAVVGDASATYQFKGTVSYQYQGSALSSRFEKSNVAQILARSPTIAIDLSAPEKVMNGQDFEVQLTYQNIADTSLQDAQISFDIPDSFTFAGADPKLDNNTFTVSQLDSNKQSVAIFSGSLSGDPYSFVSINAHAKVNIGGTYYDINTKKASISLSPSPLALNITSQDNKTVVKAGETASYTITYKNNASIALHDVVLTAQLTGAMINFATIKSDGFYNYKANTVTWTASDIPQLKQLDVGSSGNVSLQFSISPTYPIRQLSDKNFTIKVSSTITSPTVVPGISADQTIGKASISTDIAGALDLLQTAYFHEPQQSITNQGSLPPKVGDSTEYTVHWSLRAKGADFDGIALSAFLGQGFEWTGKVISNIKAVPHYNERTHEITWDVGSVLAGSGVVSTPPTAIFQIRVTPSSAQVGSQLQLISRGTIISHDAFVDTQASEPIKQLTSRDLADTSVPPLYDRVTP